MEEGARKLMDTDAEDLHGWVCGTLRQVKLPNNNFTKELRKALKELKQMNVAILPADKGNSTVLMATEDYNTKMRRLLETTTYR